LSIALRIGVQEMIRFDMKEKDLEGMIRFDMKEKDLEGLAG